ncbi:hypothetical protein RFF05_06810 [Bengtsoniella intestinalis]|uniref:hypothetical protein n=1 Tax=Bengtsoniella intestinalis TaxID=3073143 RepID=UPI00391EF7ED
MSNKTNKIDEIGAAVLEDENSVDILVLKLSKPVMHDGEPLEELTFDFGKLTGADSIKVETELERMGVIVLVPHLNGPYLCRIAVKACTTKIDMGVLQRMPILDYSQVRKATRSFLAKRA